MPYAWILFCPQLPATPSSPRVTLWRRMRSAGAMGLDNGLWLLPHTPASIQVIDELKTYVQQQGGSCKSFQADALDPATEESILRRFEEDRAEEYAEFKEQCADFLKEIEREVLRQNFSFAELEENEQDLMKLEAWLAKVNARDFTKGSQALEADEWLENCRTIFQQFAADVYTHENPDHQSNRQFDPGPLSPKARGKNLRAEYKNLEQKDKRLK